MKKISALFSAILMLTSPAAFSAAGQPVTADSSQQAEAWSVQAFKYQLDHDMGQAAFFYEKACNAGNASSCRDIGTFYQGGVYIDNGGIKPDKARATQYYAEACDGGDEAGCDSLSRLTGTAGAVNTHVIPSTRKTARTAATSTEQDATQRPPPHRASRKNEQQVTNQSNKILTISQLTTRDKYIQCLGGLDVDPDAAGDRYDQEVATERDSEVYAHLLTPEQIATQNGALRDAVSKALAGCKFLSGGQ